MFQYIDVSYHLLWSTGESLVDALDLGSSGYNP